MLTFLPLTSAVAVRMTLASLRGPTRCSRRDARTRLARFFIRPFIPSNDRGRVFFCAAARSRPRTGAAMEAGGSRRRFRYVGQIAPIDADTALFSLSLLSPDDGDWRAFASSTRPPRSRTRVWLDTLTGAYRLRRPDRCPRRSPRHDRGRPADDPQQAAVAKRMDLAPVHRHARAGGRRHSAYRDELLVAVAEHADGGRSSSAPTPPLRVGLAARSARCR